MKSVFFLITQCLFVHTKLTMSLQPTTDPPLLDVPTYSLATKNADGNTGMNILTYATPISVRPDRIWSLGLFKGTVAHENFAKTGEAVLQLLSPQHSKVVKLLGGSSGRDVDKKLECERMGMSWISINDDLPELLPDCTHYLKIRKLGDLIDCGSHDLAVCKIETMFVANGEDMSKRQHMKTADLRDLGIITEQGRVAE
jgi:flavin reductase (DIM6/NTAB) family NADH-FMN oxidoreductase RutF